MNQKSFKEPGFTEPRAELRSIVLWLQAWNCDLQFRLFSHNSVPVWVFSELRRLLHELEECDDIGEVHHNVSASIFWVLNQIFRFQIGPLQGSFCRWLWAAAFTPAFPAFKRCFPRSCVFDAYIPMFHISKVWQLRCCFGVQQSVQEVNPNSGEWSKHVAFCAPSLASLLSSFCPIFPPKSTQSGWVLPALIEDVLLTTAIYWHEVHMQFMKFIFVLESVSQVVDLPQLLPHAVSPDSARSKQSLSLAGVACDAQSLHPGRVNFFTRVPQSVTKRWWFPVISYNIMWILKMMYCFKDRTCDVWGRGQSDMCRIYGLRAAHTWPVAFRCISWGKWGYTKKVDKPSPTFFGHMKASDLKEVLDTIHCKGMRRPNWFLFVSRCIAASLVKLDLSTCFGFFVSWHVSEDSAGLMSLSFFVSLMDHYGTAKFTGKSFHQEFYQALCHLLLPAVFAAGMLTIQTPLQIMTKSLWCIRCSYFSFIFRFSPESNCEGFFWKTATRAAQSKSSHERLPQSLLRTAEWLSIPFWRFSPIAHLYIHKPCIYTSWAIRIEIDALNSLYI